MAEARELNWDDPSINVSETISEKETKTAESSGKPPAGKYLCSCVSSKPIQNDMLLYSCIAANLKWEIEQVIEIDGKLVTGDEGNEWVGKNIFDRINLFSEDEKEGMKNRRILIAKRIGLLPPSGGQLTNKHWGVDVIGKRAVINFIEEEYTDKNNNLRTARKVAFSGYESADGITAVTADDFDDI